MMSILAFADDNQGYTYGDYLTWPDEERWQLIDGVREHWIVDPEARLVRVYRLGDGGRYGRGSVDPAGAGVAVGVLPDLVIDTAALFGQAPAREAAGRRPPPRSR